MLAPSSIRWALSKASLTSAAARTQLALESQTINNSRLLAGVADLAPRAPRRLSAIRRSPLSDGLRASPIREGLLRGCLGSRFQAGVARLPVPEFLGDPRRRDLL
eukprot:5602186-Pyramimonas_sp.AAC.1